MQALTIIIICCIMVDDYLVRLLSLPSILRFAPEALSAVFVVYILFAGTRDRFRLVAPKYWLAFGALAVVILCGIVNSNPGVGPVLSGMRFYVRAVPLFFLPAVYAFTDEQLKRQLKWVLGFAFLQVPISVYQRWVIQSEGRFSGDDVKGTMLDSGILSVFLICVVVVLTGLAMRGRIGKIKYAILSLLFLIPTAINETKVTIFYLPVGLLVAVYVGAAPGKRFRYLGLGVAGLVLFGALFVPIYNMTQQYNPYKNEKDITAFFTSEKALERYMSSDVGGVGTKKDVRRGDSITVPFAYLAKDPVHLMFGLGMGAVSPSTMGKNYEGAYYQLFSKFLIISFTFFLLEFGLLGVILICVLSYLVFADTVAVARRDKTLVGDLAVGWIAVVILFVINMAYTIFHEFMSVTYLYWYFSGLMCARHMWWVRGGRSADHSGMRAA